MAITTVYDVICADCGAETVVADTHIPATRYHPAEGERSPEECPECGKPFDDEDDWQETEPPWLA